mmetsp:Transcript_21337/g.33018  ORF Transcript_21337/g.33018 Transcript_21337/m.33018 type:complete len:95 (+) Transcript_21337:208-492(+)
MMGFPDTGDGWYGRQLPYADWLKMNYAQRCQNSYFEHIVLIALSTGVASIYYRGWAFLFVMIYIVGRAIYSIGYMSSPKGRLVGALTQDVGLLA